MTLQERDPHAAEDALLQCLSAYKEVKQLISSPEMKLAFEPKI